MNKTSMKIILFVLIVPHILLSQKPQIKDDPCLSIDSFQMKCEKGLLDMKLYLNDSTLPDSDHINIMQCYNQLHWDIVGESIDRLQYRDTTYNDYFVQDTQRFTANHYSELSNLFSLYQSMYKKYVDSLLSEYESSIGHGGALYINRLHTYPSTASGQTYFILCE